MNKKIIQMVMVYGYTLPNGFKKNIHMVLPIVMTNGIPANYHVYECSNDNHEKIDI